MAYSFGLSKVELLKSLTSTVPSALSVIVAILIHFLSTPQRSIHWKTYTIQEDWQVTIYIEIINFCSIPITNISLSIPNRSYRWIKEPPETIEPLQKESFSFEIRNPNRKLSPEDELLLVKDKKLSFYILYIGGSSQTKNRKKLHVNNPLYISRANIKYMLFKGRKLWSQFFLEDQEH